MVVRFWGVRGSFPTPITPDKLREKIAAVVQRLKPEDLVNADTREQFLAGLPEWIFGTPGGNTPCLEVRLKDGTCVLLDAGTGIVEFSAALRKEKKGPGSLHLFFSHFHYDHIQGLPFLGQAYNPAIQMHFYSPIRDIEYILKDHMSHPFFPVTMQDRMTKQMFFHNLAEQPTIRLGSAEISWCRLNHPGNAFAYKVVEDGRSFVYATDTELMEADFRAPDDQRNFFLNVDVLVLDTMYTLGEAIEKYNWGHSSFSLGIDFAISWGVKTLYLFHHEPKYEDKQLYSNLHAARWYAQRQQKELTILLAEEGRSISID
jgi:phosphoribosyl 1,2-cyclic phosphodiesterase